MKTKDLVLVALFTAMLIALGLVPPLPLPWIPVPLTLQTFGVMLAGLLLGARRGGLVLVLYVAIALLGLPVLPGGRAGLAVLAGPTAGFLLGMIPGAAVIGWLSAARSNTVSAARLFAAAVCGGILLVYACGIPWLAWIAHMDLSKAAWAVLVFLPGDLFKALLATLVALRIRRLRLLEPD